MPLVVAVVIGVGLLIAVVVVFRSSRASRSEVSDSAFPHGVDIPVSMMSHASDCGDSASDGGDCDGGSGSGD